MLDSEETLYRVVRNDEEQYSLWPDHRENPAGWHDEGMVGNRQQCLDHIESVWTDMRPLSLRKRMAANPS
jgi:MbtH protein